jgi:hypothetical protein
MYNSADALPPPRLAAATQEALATARPSASAAVGQAEERPDLDLDV